MNRKLTPEENARWQGYDKQSVVQELFSTYKNTVVCTITNNSYNHDITLDDLLEAIRNELSK